MATQQVVKKTRRTMNAETWVRTIAEQLCPDCGEYACLVPVPHGKKTDDA